MKIVRIILCVSIIISSVMKAQEYHGAFMSNDQVAGYRAGEIFIIKNESIKKLFDSLQPEERVVCYYLYRALLPGNRIAADQLHRHSLLIQDICIALLEQKEILRKSKQLKQGADFVSQLEIYLTYLLVNHSQYFAKEHTNEKRTPQRLKLHELTVENVTESLKIIGRSDLLTFLAQVKQSWFDQGYEPTNCVANSINESSVNFYAPEFTDAHFDALSARDQSYLNAYYAVDRIEKYKIDGKYSKELSVAAYWLTQARDYAKQYSDVFDQPFVDSLTYLIDFLHSGDEEDFRKHAITWIKTNNRIDYTFGFIENYQDPKEFRGMFEAEVTIKSIELDKLNKILPHLEAQLPFKLEHKRELGQNSTMNASINSIVYASGEMGPAAVLAAYCLPNYEDIRAKYGSKQIIYDSQKGLAAYLNPKMYRKLFFSPERARFLDEYDQSDKLNSQFWNTHCILHETLGHGSGKLDEHTFVDGDPAEIDGHSYRIGQTVPLTESMANLLLKGDAQALEELRAEIIALYTSIAHFDELDAIGLYGEWPKVIGKEKCIEWLIFGMANTGLRRLLSQPIDTYEIAGAHAQANTIILNYLIDAGGLTLAQKKVEYEQKAHEVFCIDRIDAHKAIQAVNDLVVLVQTIKSTADGVGFRALKDQYGARVRSMVQVKLLQDNFKSVVGDVQMLAHIFPELVPVVEHEGKLIDCALHWQDSLLEHYNKVKPLILSIEKPKHSHQ